MLALFLVACLTDQPQVCAERMVPAACTEAQAVRWIEEHDGLTLQSWNCSSLNSRIMPLQVTEVAPGLFVHHTQHELLSPQNAGDLANVGFVIGADSVAVIDSGGSREVGERLFAAVRAQTALPITWLILTHMHPDHVFGASVFRESGARVIAHDRFAAALSARADTYRDALRREGGEALAIGSDIVLPDEIVQHRRDLDLGKRRLTLEAHPVAHTDNDLTVFDQETGIWWLADLVFEGHLPSIDGSALGWLSLLEQLAARPITGSIPGHGGPLLSWPEGAAPMRDYLESLIEQTRASLNRGESLSVATQHLGSNLRGDWALFDAFNTRNATVVYLELEWEQ